MSGKRAMSAEMAAEEAYRIAEMRRKASAGQDGREAHDDAKGIQGTVEEPRTGQQKAETE